jgi:hypothetical protein
MVLPLLAVSNIGDLMSDPGDFMFLAILLAGVIITFEVATRVPDRLAYRAGAGIALVAALGGAWVNFAVGIIGSETTRRTWSSRSCSRWPRSAPRSRAFAPRGWRAR